MPPRRSGQTQRRRNLRTRAALKNSIALKEARESVFWLRLILSCDLSTPFYLLPFPFTFTFCLLPFYFLLFTFYFLLVASSTFARAALRNASGTLRSTDSIVTSRVLRRDIRCIDVATGVLEFFVSATTTA